MNTRDTTSNNNNNNLYKIKQDNTTVNSSNSNIDQDYGEYITTSSNKPSLLKDDTSADGGINHEIEFFQCQKCNEYNVIKTKSKKRREVTTRHIRVNRVTWQSFKRYASLNNTTLDYALMLLLHNAQTNNISYLVNDRILVDKKPSTSSPPPPSRLLDKKKKLSFK